jgi:hypothetical protein
MAAAEAAAPPFNSARREQAQERAVIMGDLPYTETADTDIALGAD